MIRTDVVLSVVYQYELPNEFPEKVMRQAEKTPQEVQPADMEGRLDLGYALSGDD